MTHLITEQRLKMRALGYSPIPLNGKIPQINSWPNLGDTTDHQIEAWERVRPAETNTGLLTRNNPAFDVDILSNADAAQAVADLIDEWLRARGRIMVRFGRKPKRAIVAAPMHRSRRSGSNWKAPHRPRDRRDQARRHRGARRRSAARLLRRTSRHQTAIRVGRRLPRLRACFRASVDHQADAHAIVDKAVAMLAERFGVNVRTPARAARADTPMAEAKATDTATAWGAAALRTPAI